MASRFLALGIGIVLVPVNCSTELGSPLPLARAAAVMVHAGTPTPPSDAKTVLVEAGAQAARASATGPGVPLLSGAALASARYGVGVLLPGSDSEEPSSWERDLAEHAEEPSAKLGATRHRDISALLGGSAAVGTADDPSRTARSHATAGPMGTAAPTARRPRPVGGLAPEEVQAVVTRHYGEVRRCYERALKVDEDLQGRVVVSWKVRPLGTVSHVRVQRSGLGRNDDLATCIASALKRWTFPSPSEVVDINYPFFLRPEE